MAPGAGSYGLARSVAREERDDMACGLANGEYLMIDLCANCNRRWVKPESCKALMGCMQIINHEIEGSIARDDPVSQHEYQVGAAAQFIDGHLGSVEHGSHADRAHESRRLLHAVRLQDDMSYASFRALAVFGHISSATSLFLTH